jgi:hypothetical protein
MNIDGYQSWPGQRSVSERQREHPSARGDFETIEFNVFITKMCSLCPASDDLGCVIQTAKEKVLVKIESLSPAVRRGIIREGHAKTRPGAERPAYRVQLAKLKTVAKKQEWGKKIVPCGISAEIDEIKGVPVEPPPDITEG